MLRTAMTITGSRLPATEDAPEVNSDVYGGDSTRIAALERLGFAYSQKWDDLTERSLATPIPAVALPAGFAIRSATRSDAAELAAARNGAFGDSWTPESYRDEVMLKPGYDLSRELVAVTPEGRVASFAVIWLDDLTRVGHFEPVGTAPDFHNRGLAKAVMTEGLTRLRAAGMLTATVEYDATNQSAAIFYARLLFRRFSETHGFVRQFPASDSLPASH